MTLTLKLDWADPITVSGVDAHNPVVSVDHEGRVLSRLRDNAWLFPGNKLRPNRRVTVRWAGNDEDVKRLALLRLTHGKVLGTAAAYSKCKTIAQLGAFCADHGIALRDLHKHPNVVIDFCEQRAANRKKPSAERKQSVIAIARVALAAKDTLGWTFLTADQIDSLEKIDTLYNQQHPVIPRRIHQTVDEAAHAILSGYLAVADDLDDVLAVWAQASDNERRTGKAANWSALLAQRPLLAQELDLYCSAAKNLVLRYFTIVRAAAFWVIAAGSCARKNEILALCRGCLQHEQIGDTKTYLLTSATSKTQDNPNAIWVASPRVEPAVHALERSLDSYIRHHPNPPNLTGYLFQTLQSNFGRRLPRSRARKPTKLHYGSPSYNTNLHLVAVHANMRITEGDRAEAKHYTPELDEAKYAVGQNWPLTAHQIRRTVLVYAAACGLVSQDSLSFQAKHQTWQMTAYYCRHYWQLLNTDPNNALVAGTRASDAQEYTRIYADAYNQARSQAMEDDRLFSPYGQEHKRSVIATTPLLSLEEVKQGQAHAVLKRNTLGLCALDGYCPWQKAITVKGCMTKAGGKPCSKAIVDSARLSILRAIRDDLGYQLDALRARDTFAREQLQADITAADEAIDLITKHRTSHAELA